MWRFRSRPGQSQESSWSRVFQSAPGPFHMAFWAKATPETPFKMMTGIAMRAARLSTVLASNVDETNLQPRVPLTSRCGVVRA